MVLLFKLIVKMLKVSPFRIDEETFYSVKRVNIRGKSIDTPKKSVNLERVREDIGIHAEFFEIYRTLNEERIKSLIADAGKQVKFNYNMNNLVRKAQHFPAAITIFIPSLTYLNPSENELSFIIATQKQYSDFYIVPTVERLNFDKEVYGYHKIREAGGIEEIYPADSRVKPEYLLDDSLYRRRKAQATFNYEQIGMETERLKRVIDEGTVGSYVRSLEEFLR